MVTVGNHSKQIHLNLGIFQKGTALLPTFRHQWGNFFTPYLTIVLENLQVNPHYVKGDKK